MKVGLVAGEWIELVVGEVCILENASAKRYRRWNIHLIFRRKLYIHVPAYAVGSATRRLAADVIFKRLTKMGHKIITHRVDIFLQSTVVSLTL